MDQVRIDIQVVCYAGYRGEETPRRLRFHDREVEVVEVLDHWLAPDHRYFKVRGDDGGMYLIRHEVRTGDWELTLYDAGLPTPGDCGPPGHS